MFSILFSPIGAAMVQTQEWMYTNITPEYLQAAYHGVKLSVLVVAPYFS